MMIHYISTVMPHYHNNSHYGINMKPTEHTPPLMYCNTVCRPNIVKTV